MTVFSERSQDLLLDVRECNSTGPIYSHASHKELDVWSLQGLIFASDPTLNIEQILILYHNWVSLTQLKKLVQVGGLFKLYI